MRTSVESASTIEAEKTDSPIQEPQELKIIDPTIWVDIIEDYENNKKEVEKYMFAKDPNNDIDPSMFEAFVNY